MTGDRQALLAACLENMGDDAPWGAYADWLGENGLLAEEALVRARLTWPPVTIGPDPTWLDDDEPKPPAWRTIPLLDDYDWRQAFGFAGEPGTEAGGRPPTKAAPTLDVDTGPFARAHVAEVIAHRDGERDERNWVCVGRLWDGRWFVVDAGCDYTGWD